MRVLALDIGEVRTGVAVSDAARRAAQALEVLNTRDVQAAGRRLAQVVSDYQVDTLVIGLPLETDGCEGRQARYVRSTAAKLLDAAGGACDAPCVFVDERQSSAVATERGHAAGLTEQQMRGQKDSRAAAVILQRYLDTSADD
ncbi:MAG: Holliday junction resolvase RuvX [Actinomycetes bacterium]|nr:Holliday junction resolvase RuvX [Actinomycetes bacterium]